jgi:osmoprotectant transport system permease protein
MAGVRISAVTAVGLMTIAAFIGAGGLGFLVFSGIRTVNNNQILAGAIPACLLALLVDFLIGLVEKLVTPISLQTTNNKSKSELLKSRKLQKLTLSVSTICIAFIFGVSALAGTEKNKKVISIGSKDFTEQLILGHMYSDLIEAKTDISVNRRINLGGTQVCFNAMTSKDLDMYIDYSGTMYTDVLKYPPISDMAEVYSTSKKEIKEKYNIQILDQIGFNNTYVLAVKKSTAEKYNLKTISDMAKVADQLVSGTTLEFLNREDGILGLKRVYNFEFKKAIGIDSSPRYIALDNNETDIVDAFSTDGLLKKFDLVTLEDDKHFFPPYYAIPLVNADTLEKYPELLPVINELAGVLTDDIMIELNYQVDELQREPETVAKEFLKQKGLIE